MLAVSGWKSDLSDEEIVEKLLALLPSLRSPAPGAGVRQAIC
jgi:hypothetical protein